LYGDASCGVEGRSRLAARRLDYSGAPVDVGLVPLGELLSAVVCACDGQSILLHSSAHSEIGTHLGRVALCIRSNAETWSWTWEVLAARLS
jgi:hypothetical protein